MHFKHTLHNYVPHPYRRMPGLLKIYAWPRCLAVDTAHIDHRGLFYLLSWQRQLTEITLHVSHVKKCHCDHLARLHRLKILMMQRSHDVRQ